uniref:RxLR effector candidate protein n=1 Tax=Hyaloperonospora arabidopsidis (strain Emoy2) TaxID=559515 RepID=M4BB90_HYAAE
MVARNALRAVVFAALAMCVSIMDARAVTRSLTEKMPPTASVSTSTGLNKPTETAPKEPESYTLANLNGSSDASRVKSIPSNDEKNNSGGQSGSSATRKSRSEIIASLTKGDEAKSRSFVSSRDINSETSTSFDHRSGASSRDETESSATSKTEKSSGRRSTKQEKGSRESKQEDEDDDEYKDASTRLTDAQRKVAKEARHKAQLERKAKRQAQKEEWRKIREKQRAEHEAAKERARSETSAIQEAAGVTRNSTVTKEHV